MLNTCSRLETQCWSRDDRPAYNKPLDQTGPNTPAIARGKDKESQARGLGARHYIDSQSQKPAQELVKLGGAKVILATVTNGKAMSATVGGFAVDGKLVIVGAASDPIEVSALQLLSGRTITG